MNTFIQRWWGSKYVEQRNDPKVTVLQQYTIQTEGSRRGHKITVVNRVPRPYWEEHGWQKEGGNYRGVYQTRFGNWSGYVMLSPAAGWRSLFTIPRQFWNANWAADLFSKSWQSRGSTSVGTARENTVSKNYSSSDSLDFEVLPGAFTSLRKGGPDCGLCVDGIIFQGGRIWDETSKNHIKVGFAQR